MNGNTEELDSLFHKIQENKKTYDFSDNISLDALKEICDESEQITSVVEFSKFSLSVVYNNENVFNFLGITQSESVRLGFDFFLKVLHPDNLGSLYLLIKFFNDPDNENKIFSNTYYVKSVDGWEWIYNSMKPVTRNEDGTIKYLMSTSCSLAGQFKSSQQFRHLKKNLEFFEENLEKYLSMTDKEKKILGLIAEELSFEEIADIMSVSSADIASVAKKLTLLFNVKSAEGLVKFAMLFNLI